VCVIRGRVADGGGRQCFVQDAGVNEDGRQQARRERVMAVVGEA